MKKGLLIYKSYGGLFNIGDYIQSLAAKQFMGSIDKFICRESLNTYNDEEIKLIMNGWFTHEPKNWPPSNNINPFFISFHLNSSSKDELLVPKNIEYLKKHEPIGCRDRTTATLLNKYGIKAYFSGCLTLTLGKTYKTEEKTEEILFVDPYFEIKKDPLNILKYLINLFLNFKSLKYISKSYYKESSLRSLLKASAFFSQYRTIFDVELLRNGIYIQKLVHESQFNSEEDKFKHADYLLNKYAKAKLIITNRIHCALPSIGMDTSVIFIENANQPETSSCRLDGLRELFNTITYDKGKLIPNFIFEDSKINKKTIIQNKRDHLNLKEKLIKACLNSLN